MTRIKDWKARRAGAAITITGRTEDGKPIKLTGVESIEAGIPSPIASDARGECFELLIG